MGSYLRSANVVGVRLLRFSAHPSALLSFRHQQLDRGQGLFLGVVLLVFPFHGGPRSARRGEVEENSTLLRRSVLGVFRLRDDADDWVALPGTLLGYLETKRLCGGPSAPLLPACGVSPIGEAGVFHFGLGCLGRLRLCPDSIRRSGP